MSHELHEATIAGIHAALLAGDVRAADLVAGYRARIEAYDRGGPMLNAVVTLNARALEEAERLDAALARGGELCGPLHGVPVVVKDQVETAGIRTTFGSQAMADYLPERDATLITRLRDAGAVILAKTTMPDFATSWFSCSSLSGTTRNPYHLAHDAGGSSSGTGAAVAANLAAVGIGEDTGGSIRLPSSFCNLVGLKVTPGLISRAGMSPLVAFQDSAGPMCRTVEDAARLLDVLAGFDAADPGTATAVIAGPARHAERLRDATLEGRTIGVVREAFGADSEPGAAAVNTLMDRALQTMEAAGARVVEVAIPDLAHYLELTSLYITHSRHDIDAFLGSRPALAGHTVASLRAAGRYHPALDLFEAIAEGPEDPYSEPDYYRRYTAREAFQREIVNAMARAGTAALAFPTARIPAPSREALDAGRWTTFSFPTNTLIAAQSWMPAVSVPAGLTPDGLPVGMELVGLPYGEADLLCLARAFERVTDHRQAPESTLPLGG